MCDVRLMSVWCSLGRGLIRECLARPRQSVRLFLSAFHPLGPYHLKMTLDHLVAADYIPSKWVSCWPIAAGSGTAWGLAFLFDTETSIQWQLRDMLLELLVRLRKDGACSSGDWLGTIGASLCWFERKQPASAEGVTAA